MTTVKGIFLDLDDTIVAFEMVGDTSWRAAIAGHQNRLAPLTPEEAFTSIKASARRFWSDPDRQRLGRLDLHRTRRTIISGAFQTHGIDDAILVGDLADDYDRIRNEAVYVFPGALQAIRHFKADGRRLALITNGAAEPQRAKIDRFGLADHFDLILIEGEQGMGKPDPRVYQQALITFGLVPSEAVMAGDNWEWDVMGAARVGITPIWVNPGDKPRPDGGTLEGVLSVRTIAELPDII